MAHAVGSFMNSWKDFNSHEIVEYCKNSSTKKDVLELFSLSY